MNTGQKQEVLVEMLQIDFSLSEKEARAVLDLKLRGTIEVNGRIRNNTLTEEDKQFCDHLNSGLSKLPKITSEIIYRNLKIYEWQIEKCKSFFSQNVGNIVLFKDFLSCTRIEVFNGDQSTYEWVMAIQTLETSSGRDIEKIWQKYDLHDPEKEVAFASNSCFKILHFDPDSYLKVLLEEIEDCSGAIVVPTF